MKKILLSLLLIVLGIAVGLSAALTVFYIDGDTQFNKVLGRSDEVQPVTISSEASNADMTQYAYTILGYIKTNDFEALSQVVHPEYCVMFSPYATIATASNKCFTPMQVAGFAEDVNRYVWGKYDGTGNPIELTPVNYVKEFVFDKDFTLATEIGINTVIKSGNSLENINDVFPNVQFVEFHIPGTDIETDGLDWKSLRLGFEDYNGQLMLTVIVHSEWTV